MERKLESWSRGRIALVGDASSAPSLVSGQGSAFAMAGAYILAGELKEANGDYQRAFGTYDTRLKPFIDHQQKEAEQSVRWAAPRTQGDIWLRDLVTRVMDVPFVSKLVISRFVDVRFTLPEYSY